MAKDFSNVPAGPGAVAETGVAPLPLLDGATDYEVVEIHNPLSVAFTGVVGISRPVNVPFEIRSDGVTTTTSRTEGDVMRNYSLPLKNADYPAQGHIQQRINIPSGTTVRVQGAQAQVILRQLVNEIMSREGNQLLMADAFARNQVEQRIVLRRSSIQDYMDVPKDISTQMSDAVIKLNEAPHEEAFAGLRQDPAGKTDPVTKSTPSDSNPPATAPAPSKKTT